MGKKRYGNELHPLYTRWLTITQRCTNPNHSSYKNYGSRGISLSSELSSFEDFKNFVETLPGYDSNNGSLDRIDNNKGYEKTNLRWASRSLQTANQRGSGKGLNQFTGVNWSVTHNRWIARIHYEGKCLFTKVCMTEEKALNERNAFIQSNQLPHPIQTFK